MILKLYLNLFSQIDLELQNKIQLLILIQKVEKKFILERHIGLLPSWKVC